MSINPASIPPDVVKAALRAWNEGNMSHAIAAALTALMDDESVKVLYEPTASRGVVSVRPSDVLAAVLARSAA